MPFPPPEGPARTVTDTGLHELRRRLRNVVLVLGGATAVALAGLAGHTLTHAQASWPLAATAVAVTLAPVALRRLAHVQEALARTAAEALASEGDVLATTSEWVWSSDPHGVLTASNALVERFLDRRVEALIGRNVLALLHPDDREAVAAQLRAPETLRGGWTGRLLRWRHRDGSFRWLESSGVAVLAADGRLVGYRGSNRDVTEQVLRRLADEAAQVAEDEKRDRILAVLQAPDRLLHVAFQPVVALDNGAVVGVEALSRFLAEPPRPPDRWFAEAGEVGLAEALELTAVRAALRELHLLPDGYVALNLSPDTIVSPGFAALRTEDGFPTDRIVVELTEQANVDGYDRLRRVFDDLRMAGMRVAVDDTGAGYASLKHVLELRPDFIKLDQAIVRGIDGDPVRYALAVALAEFAREIGAEVVAEGVETEGELEAVRNAGVSHVQGYLVARPGPLPVPGFRLPSPTMPTVMVVDDDPLVRLLVARMVRQAGLELVGQASDGREGVALAAELRPDIVILDLAMPVLGGMEALPLLRATLPQAQVVVMSSRLPRGVRQGVAFAIDKQETSTRLPEILSTLVERFQRRPRKAC